LQDECKVETGISLSHDEQKSMKTKKEKEKEERKRRSRGREGSICPIN
jgi:hypothetical protein